MLPRNVGKSHSKLSLGLAKPRVALAVEDRWRKQAIEAFLIAEGFSVGDHHAELVLADPPRPWRDIRESMVRLRIRFPGAEILVLIPELRYGYVDPCLRAGAMGVLHFNSEPALILRAIDAVRRGDIWAPRNLIAKVIQGLRESRLPFRSATEFTFTRAERRIVRALRDELTNKEIGNLLQVSESTVKFHISRLLRKTHSANRYQLRRIGIDLTP